MNQSLRIALSIFTAIGLSGCAQLAPVFLEAAVTEAATNPATYDYLSGSGQPSIANTGIQPPIAETEIDVDELKSVKTIALLELPDTSGYWESELEFESFNNTLQKFLKRHLEESGFNVIDLPANRKNKLHLKDNYRGLDIEVADAFLDIAPKMIGYASSAFDQRYDEGFGPNVTVVLRLVSAQSKTVIYAGTAQYGWAMDLSLSGIKIDSPGEHRFEFFEAISVQKEEAIHQLEYGIEAISASIVKKITKGELVSVLSTPKAQTESSADRVRSLISYSGSKN